MKEKNIKVYFRIAYIALAVIAATFLILDRILEKWYFFLIGALALGLLLVTLFLMQRTNKTINKIDSLEDDNEKIKKIVEDPKTAFEKMLKDAYDGTLIDHLKPLYIKECNVYADEDNEYGIELIVEEKELNLKVLINNTKICINDEVKDYNFLTEFELYEYIKTNVK